MSWTQKSLVVPKILPARWWEVYWLKIEPAASRRFLTALRVAWKAFRLQRRIDKGT